SAKDRIAAARKILPAPRLDDRLHVRDPLHAIRVPARPVESERRPPIVQYQNDSMRQVQGFEPGVEIARVIAEAVRAGRRWPGATHSDEIGCKASAEAGEKRNDVAPQIRRGRIAVEKHNRIAAADVDIAHSSVEDLDLLTRVSVGARKLGLS